MKVKFKKLNENAKLPKQGTEKAGGWDIYATEIIKESDGYYRVKTGFALQPPPNYKITIVPRSNLTKHSWVVLNSPILGDEDYVGEYEIRFKGIPIGIEEYRTGFGAPMYEEFPYEVGDRCSQLYLEKVIPIEFEEVEELDKSERGVQGFGSTGLK